MSNKAPHYDASVRRLAWYIGGTTFAAALGAAIARSSADLWPLFVVSVLLGFVGWAAEQPAVRGRFPILHTPVMRFRAVYEPLLKLQEPLHLYGFGNGPPTPRPEWLPRIVAWDRTFWPLLDHEFPAHVSSYRMGLPDIATLIENDFGGDKRWAGEAATLLNGRMGALHQLRELLPRDR